MDEWIGGERNQGGGKSGIKRTCVCVEKRGRKKNIVKDGDERKRKDKENENKEIEKKEYRQR